MNFRSLRLVVEDLDLERGGRMLVRGLNFDLRSGEALVVTGPNGAGKTTLLRALAGLLRPRRGRLRLEGDQEAPASPGAWAHYLGHANGLKSSMTPLENLDFWAAMLDVGAGGGLAPLKALGRMGLEALADLPCGYLSAGQKRRAAAARLLVARRPIWLLDEPTAALDALSQARMEDLILDHLAEGGLVAVSTHAAFPRLQGRELRLGLG